MTADNLKVTDLCADDSRIVRCKLACVKQNYNTHKYGYLASVQKRRSLQ
jgi:hypothetical protein